MKTNGNCFRCHQPGHWISDCPLKSNAVNLSPEIHCPCGGGICLTKVSSTKENPGRRFYKCPTAQSCSFFKWCDKVTDGDIRFRPAFTIPECPCGSGPCRRIKVDSGPDSGRAYLICSVKKGFGACGFFQWEDDAAFWEEADLVSSHVENRFLGNVRDNDKPVACAKLNDMVVSDMNHGSSGMSIVPEEQVPVVIQQEELLVKTVPCDRPTICLFSDSNFKESSQVNVDEGVNDLVRYMTNHGDQATNCVIPIGPEEQVTMMIQSEELMDVDEELCDLVRDTVSIDGSVVTNHEQPVAGNGEAEWSFPDMQDLMEQYNSEKLRLESISGKHAQVLSAFMGSFKRLRLLQDKALILRKTLLETEKEMACCEAETLEFGASCREVAVELAESQKRMRETTEKLGKEVELLKQKEGVSMKRKRG